MNIAIDIGGTNTRISFFEKNSIMAKETIKFDTFQNVEDNFNKILEKIKEKYEFKKIEGIGISAPGPTDYKKGIFGKLPNLLDWENFNFLDYLKIKTGIKNIKSQNDANLMALANHHYFKKTKDDITQFFTVSTGLGGGLVINNKIFTGASGYAQEIATAPLAWTREAGKGLGEGALELFSAGSGIFERSKEWAQSTKEVFDSYETNLKAKKVIDEAIETLANAIATIAAFINPSMIVFDGSVARHNQWFINKAIEISKNRMFKEQWEAIDFKISELGDNSALLGALYLITK